MLHCARLLGTRGENLGKVILALGVIGMVGVAGAGCQQGDSGAKSDTTASTAPQTSSAGQEAAMSPVERGKYLVTISGCNDCHTPLKMEPNGQPEPDMSLMLSGHPEKLVLPPVPKMDMPWIMIGSATATAYGGPWGVSYAMNLTPDSLTGIGSWTEEIFMNTLRSGKHWGASRPIMPPMPWQGIAKMTDGDLKAMYAFLRTIPPIKNKVPDYQPPAGAPAGAPTAAGDSTKHM